MDLTEFGFRKDFDFENRLDLKDEIDIDGTIYIISTVDLGLNHGHWGVPLYYETMIFKEAIGIESYCDRYEKEKQAVEGHEKVLKALRNNKFTLDEYGFNFKEEY